ncbi:hypothetical protein LCGC14_1906110 [marine sediment metagenome]|uniref:Glycosyltransferase 2-like domain-containing protein n=1 Tax=marine sediment metagenome TaxID=412755 RepID=A0A0F9ITA5_9ZZZZ
MENVTIIIAIDASQGIDLTTLNSVVKHTNHPYEMSLLFNKPTKDVIGYLSKSKLTYQITKFDDTRYEVWNYGLEISDTEYVCFIPDSGMIVLDNWLAHMMKHAGKNTIVSPHVLTNDKVLCDFWGLKYIDEPVLPHNEEQIKQVSANIACEYHNQTDDNVWLRPWLVHRETFKGWCTDQPHPANMDVVTLNILKNSGATLIRSLDSSIILFN